MKKKRILFVIESLNFGGAERSLINLLSMLDYDMYQVDLQLLNAGSAWMNILNTKVNVLPVPEYIKFLSCPLNEIFRYRKWLNVKWIVSRLLFSIILRLGYHIGNEYLKKMFWITQGCCFDKSKKFYDYAIAFSQGIPTYYVNTKVNSKKKFAWINVELDGKYRKYNQKYYCGFDSIITVSEKIKTHTIDIYPNLTGKIKVIYDLIDAKMIINMSLYNPEDKFDISCPVILTVGRYNWQKGYEYAIQTAAELKKKQINFKWFAIGDGPLRKKLNAMIQDQKLENFFFLLGARSNPFPYMRKCDIYVQTSRMEGFGLTVAEAKILEKPIVTTDFNTARLQITDRVNGLIASFEPVDIANKIELLLKDKVLYSAIKKNLKYEKKGNLEDIEKFYELIEE